MVMKALSESTALMLGLSHAPSGLMGGLSRLAQCQYAVTTCDRVWFVISIVGTRVIVITEICVKKNNQQCQ